MAPDLPTEILLQIASYSTHTNRNRDLLNFALVAKPWTPVAQEHLLRYPRFELQKIYTFMCRLQQQQQLIDSISTLEIWSRKPPFLTDFSQDAVYRKQEAPAELLRDAFTLNALEIFIEHNTTYHDEAGEWKKALREDFFPAMLGILLMLLPNLKTLKFADSWLCDFPIFRYMVLPRCLRDADLGAWDSRFSVDIVKKLRKCLEVLEIPRYVRGMNFGVRKNPVFDLSLFDNLRHLTLPYESILHKIRAPNSSTSFIDSRFILPLNLETIRIVDARYLAANFAKNITSAKQRRYRFHLSLTRIEILCCISIPLIEAQAESLGCMSYLKDVQPACTTVGIALYLYSPGWQQTSAQAIRALEQIDDHLWRRNMRFQMMTRNTEIGPYWEEFEREWDWYGDVLMFGGE